MGIDSRPYLIVGEEVKNLRGSQRCAEFNPITRGPYTKEEYEYLQTFVSDGTPVDSICERVPSLLLFQSGCFGVSCLEAVIGFAVEKTDSRSREGGVLQKIEIEEIAEALEKYDELTGRRGELWLFQVVG